MKDERQSGGTGGEKENRMKGKEGERAVLPPDSHMDGGSQGSDWLKVSLSAAAAAPGLVRKWLSGAAAAAAALSPE